MTERNLIEAFAQENRANGRYLYLAQKSQGEGLNDVRTLFRLIAESKTRHAHRHLEELQELGDLATGKPLGSAGDNLKAAIAGATHEYTDIYPGMACAARQGGFDEIADWFETPPRPGSRVPKRRSTRSDMNGSLRTILRKREYDWRQT